MSEREKFSIYRLREELFCEWDIRDYQTIHTKMGEICSWYSFLGNGTVVKWLTVRVYHRQKNWFWIRNFVEDLFNEWQKRNNRTMYETKTNHDLIFLYNENCIYVVATWSGSKELEEFIDDEFSTKILKKSLNPDFKYADTRNISWQIYAQQQSFRWEYSFDQMESFGKIYKTLTGKLKEDSLLKNHFSTDRNVWSVINLKSIKIGRSVNIEELVDLVKKLEVIYQQDLTNDEKKIFAFLDTLIPITMKEKKEWLLKEFFKQKIFSYLTWNIQNVDIEFCSPENIANFFCGNLYILSKWSYSKSFEDYNILNILNDIKGKYDFVNMQLDTAFDIWKDYHITVELDTTWNQIPQKRSLKKCIHGEFIFDWIYYFVIDGNVYKLSESFRETLKNDRKKILENPQKLINTIPFSIGTNILREPEGVFNEKQLDVQWFLCCDRIFSEGRWKIELFDLLYETDNDIYIIHVKKDFDTSTRDVCSQIELWAKYIEEDMLNSPNDPRCIVDLYNKIVSYNLGDAYKIRLRDFFINNITLDQFKGKFRKNRHYVIGLILRNSISVNNIDDYQSNIARNEIVNTNNLFKMRYSDKLRIAFITP